MRPGVRTQVGVPDGLPHLRPAQQRDSPGPPVVREFPQDLGLGGCHGGDVGSGFTHPQSGAGGRREPSRPRGVGDRLDDVGLAGEACVSEVLDGGAHGAVLGVQDSHAPALFVGQEGRGQSHDPGSDDEKVC